MKQTPCPVCGEPVDVRPARGRKSRKPFIMLVWSRDGRHGRQDRRRFTPGRRVARIASIPSKLATAKPANARE